MRLLKFFFAFYLLLITYYLLLTPAHAQVPPTNPPVPCDKTDDPEFHSLRPYQANAECQSKVTPYASFCGNNLTLKDTVTAQYPNGGGICKQEGGKIICKFSVSVNKPITIKLSGANLPIMGNTEEVTNYKGEADQLTDAQKVNEYVSWYLNGVVNRKEYPEKTDNKSVVNFSGPINKLLPQQIQQAERVKSVERAIGKDINNDGKTPAQDRHNQIAVCYETVIDSNLLPPALKWALEHLGIGKAKPTNCPNGDKMRLAGNSLFYDSWEGSLSFYNQIIGTGFNLAEFFAKLIPSVAGDVIEKALAENEPWNYKVPPLPWGNTPGGKPFDSITYQKAYNEWLGKTCILIPIPRFLVCTENFLVPNKYANLFPYVPLSSTEDKKGGVMIDSISSATQTSSRITVTDVSFSNQKPADLFFSHMQETDDLGNILQSTFAQKGADLTGSPTGVDPAKCDTVDVRSNKGDDLFAGEIAGDLKYNAAFSCEFKTKQQQIQDGECGTIGVTFCPIQYCSKDVYISLSTKSATPNIENIWSRLVAGPSSVFKRIFPKLGEGSGIGSIKDIPGSTAITYSGSGVNESADLKLPHIGGISEYFLKGIQTILRPKGYGETISFGVVSSGQCIPSEGDVDPAIADATSKYGVPEGLLRAIYQIEGVEFIADPQNYVCSENEAGAAGVMQITQGAYQLVTCENERMDNNLDTCGEPGKLSRCVIHDAFELATRVLLSKVGLWSYNDCKPLGTFPNNKQDIYNAACRYYGSFSPDVLTIHAAQGFGLPDPDTKNYCGVVCYLMGLCPPFPAH